MEIKNSKIVLFLPFPISVNRYYIKGRIISPEGREFTNHTAFLIKERNLPTINYKIKFDVYLFPPDRRVRDLDNYMKSLQDALTKAGFWTDDRLIDQQSIFRGETIPGGKTIIVVQKAGKVITLDELLSRLDDS